MSSDVAGVKKSSSSSSSTSSPFMFSMLLMFSRSISSPIKISANRILLCCTSSFSTTSGFFNIESNRLTSRSSSGIFSRTACNRSCGNCFSISAVLSFCVAPLCCKSTGRFSSAIYLLIFRSTR
ncbi:hypothetical protein WN66_06743 [Saccharomyces cerevisiae]|nr:hypothetical protein WN66_06743 [Saccharomyces cerevisiae]